jgi:hypothetical protein
LLFTSGRRSGLVDLLITRSGVRRAHLDRRADVLELPVTAISIKPVKRLKAVAKEEAVIPVAKKWGGTTPQRRLAGSLQR